MKKTYTILALLFYLCTAQEVQGQDDFLLSIMRSSWVETPREEAYSNAEGCPEKYNEVTEVYSDNSGDQYANGEHYSWDNLYINPYENTEVITDPYGDQNY